MIKIPSLNQEVYYPETDGKPMAETDMHRKVMVYLLDALEARYAEHPDVYVAGNLLLYYEEGDPDLRVAPDVFVVFGVDKTPRRIYKLWEEGKAPDVVFELTARSTRKVDIGAKRGLYEALGVQEYYLIDVLNEYLPEPFQAFRLVKDRFEQIPVEQEGETKWKVHSDLLELEIEVHCVRGACEVRLFDPKTALWLPGGAEASTMSLELQKQLTQAQARAEQEAQARAELEARLKALQAEIERLKNQS